MLKTKSSFCLVQNISNNYERRAEIDETVVRSDEVAGWVSKKLGRGARGVC